MFYDLQKHMNDKYELFKKEMLEYIEEHYPNGCDASCHKCSLYNSIKPLDGMICHKLESMRECYK